MSRPALPAAYRAAAWMALTIGSFLSLAAAARSLAPVMSAAEMLFFRSLVGVLVLAALLVRLGPARVATRRAGLHLARNLVHFAGQWGWTVGVTLLPLAEVFAIEFTTPVWLALIAVLVLGERLAPHRLVAIAGGLLGVLLVVRPGFATVGPATWVVLGAALCFAGSVAMVKALTRTETATTIIFYMSLMQAPMALLPALPDWVWPGAAELPALLVMGLAGLGAHFGLARALAIADAALVAPMDFVRLPAAALLGLLAYGEPIDAWTLAGASLIFAANYHAVRREVARP